MPCPKLAVMGHMFHPHLFEEMRGFIDNIPYDPAIFLTTCSEANEAELARLFPKKACITLVPNRGRDIAPKLITLAQAHANFDLVLHLHTKDSMSGWRRYILKCLAGSPQQAEAVISAFLAKPELGMVGPTYPAPIRAWLNWGNNERIAGALMRRMGIDPSDVVGLDFPAGSMFWARPVALRPLFDLKLQTTDFPPEPIGVDGTLGHAIERLFYIACEAAGRSWETVDESGSFSAGPKLYHASVPDWKFLKLRGGL